MNKTFYKGVVIVKNNVNKVKGIKAAVLLGPKDIQIKEFPYPKLEEGSLLIRMEMSGVCGTDKHGYKGESIQYAGTEAEIYGPYPAIPGHENVGYIEEINNSNKGFGHNSESMSMWVDFALKEEVVLPHYRSVL